jgi:hypothetical protein
MDVKILPLYRKTMKREICRKCIEENIFAVERQSKARLHDPYCSPALCNDD